VDVHTLGFFVFIFNKVVATGTDSVISIVLAINTVALT